MTLEEFKTELRKKLRFAESERAICEQKKYVHLHILWRSRVSALRETLTLSNRVE